MSTIIQRAQKSFTGSKILIIPKTDTLVSSLLSVLEVNSISHAHAELEISLFEFNRLHSWVFVHFIDVSGSAAQQLEACRKAGNSILARINGYKIKEVEIVDQSMSQELVLAYSEGMALGNYRFLKHKKDASKDANSLQTIFLLKKNIDATLLSQMNILIQYVYSCRDLVNEPVSTLNTLALAQEIEAMALKSGVSTDIMGAKKLEALKMGGILAVNKGSVDPPVLITMEYKPEKPINDQPLVLVGKGVVFDTGGLNLKTGDYMSGMKCDMAGAATVATAICSIAEMKLPVHVIAIIPATDNRPGNNAMAPGDVITMFDGTRVEVLNTDAEGRLILGDALSYASRYKPMLCLNFATLTGAASRAIGKYGIVAMQNNAKEYLSTLEACGEKVYERLAIFPFWEEYGEQIKSDIADLKNIGGAEAGMITAGKFLAHFTDYPFIHFDIAGPAFLDKADAYRTSGGTATGLRLIVEFCRQLSEEFSK